MSTTVDVLPLASYADGPVPSIVVDVPANATSVSVSVQRCTSAAPTIWPNAATTVTFTVELSLDGGITWSVLGSATYKGGIIYFDGNELPWATMGFEGLSASAGRKLQSNLTVSGGPLYSKAQAVFGP